MPNPADLLVGWIARSVPPEALAWFDGTRADIARDPTPRRLAAAFGLVSRRLGKADLALQPVDLAAAEASRPGWQPSGLTTDQAARIVLLLGATAGGEPFHHLLKGLVGTADLGELIAIYKGLPLYPEPETLVPLATDGLRTAMRAVFEAVAHRNPFPAEHFPQSAWNHMVLKTLFIDSTLHPISGLDRRWNPELAGILVDYAHERWAAHRPVTPELWRGVGRFADAAAVADLSGLLAGADETDRQAAALALAESRHPAAVEALARHRDLADAVASGEITWNDARFATPPS